VDCIDAQFRIQPGMRRFPVDDQFDIAHAFASGLQFTRQPRCRLEYQNRARFSRQPLDMPS